MLQNKHMYMSLNFIFRNRTPSPLIHKEEENNSENLELPKETENTCHLEDHNYCLPLETSIYEALCKLREENILLKNQKKEHVEIFGIERFSSDDNLIRFYTGFPTCKAFRCFLAS